MFNKDTKIIKKSGLFDAEYYLNANPDVQKVGIDPIKHFVKYGWKEGRNPSVDFDVNFYLITYADVADANINPLIHYIKYGHKEGRKINASDPATLQPSKISKFKQLIRLGKYTKNNPHLVKKFFREVRISGLSIAIVAMKQKINSANIDKQSISINRNSTLQMFCNKAIDNDVVVDIIIPIYNGYDFVIDCFESILKYTDLSKHRLILVDDCSNDKALLSFYETLSSFNNLNIILLKNTDNLGFIGSVNNGMKYGHNDVILLNSDTVVTSNWIQKMSTCAYSKNNIGTVTALSNNATLCSVPRQWSDNELPDGFTIDTFANLIEVISPMQYPEIPSPVGFCMYIKRECLNKYGYFDPIYGKGYAEENDFGMRLYRNGYIHVCDDSTFIYHKGSMTFGNNPEKLEKIRKNAEILYARYPELKDLLVEFETHNTMNQLYDIINLTLEIRQAENKVILINVAPLDKFPSGALKHQIELIDALKENFLFINFYSEDSQNVYIEVFNNNKYDHVYLGKYTGEYDDNSFHLNELLVNLIDIFNIKLIHFQTPQHFPLSLIETAKRKKCKVLFTMHDFLLFCPNYTLIDNNSNFCNFENNLDTCTKCLNFTTSSSNMITNNDIVKRKKYINEIIISSVHKFISPSKSHTDLIIEKVGIPASMIEVIPHPFKFAKKFESNNKNNEVLSIAFLGNFTEIKGSEEFRKIVVAMKNSKINWFVVGKMNDWKSYDMLHNKYNVFFHGEYQYDQIGSLINKYSIDLCLNLSKCYESYSYTLTEAFSHDVLTITNTHGATAERINKYTSLGWVVDDQDLIHDVCALIHAINYDKNLLQQKKNLIKHEVQEEDFKQYIDIYHEGLQV